MKVLAVEPWYGGSHARFLDELTEHLNADVRLVTLPARGWKWRMRTSGIQLAGQLESWHEQDLDFDVLLVSSYVDLPQFLALAPKQVSTLPTMLYFHENQFAYPVRNEDPRDLHFGVTTISSSLAASRVCFNSRYNRDTFLEGADDLLRRVPDGGMGNAVAEIQARSEVLPVPLDFREHPPCTSPRPNGAPIVLWNHRWEHDKNPDDFFDALFQLQEEGLEFRVAVVGESFRDHPDIFDKAQNVLADRIEAWGHIDSREDYMKLLQRSSVVVSTTHHEFQGLSVLEAVAQGAWPILPHRVVYPEIFPDTVLYRNPTECVDRLRQRLSHPQDPDPEMMGLAENFSWEHLGPRWHTSLSRTASCS